MDKKRLEFLARRYEFLTETVGGGGVSYELSHG